MTLTQAWSYLDNIKPDAANFFESVASKYLDSMEQEISLENYFQFKGQIMKVEERVGIAELIDKLDSVESLRDYYDPGNKILYYKEGIDVSEVDYATAKYADYSKQVQELEEEIEHRRENISVELDN